MDEPVRPTDESDSIPAHAGLRYALFRLLLLIVVGGVLYLIGMRSWPLLFTTVLVSAVLSFFVLRRQREEAARSLEASVGARSTRRRHAGPQTATTDPDGAPEPPSRGAGPAQGGGQSSMQGET